MSYENAIMVFSDHQGFLNTEAKHMLCNFTNAYY